MGLSLRGYSSCDSRIGTGSRQSPQASLVRPTAPQGAVAAHGKAGCLEPLEMAPGVVDQKSSAQATLHQHLRPEATADSQGEGDSN